MFARAGVRFESHLGHAEPLVRGVLALMCGHLASAGSSDIVRGLCLAPRWPVRLCGWRGQGFWLVGPPLAGIWGCVPSYLTVPVVHCWPSLIHGWELW
jgi:hypothetical protein